MAFHLTSTRRRRVEQPIPIDDLVLPNTEPEMRPTQPLQPSPDAAEPSRPLFNFGRQEPLATETSLPATTVTQREQQEIPYSQYDLDVAELDDRTRIKVKDKNGRWKSFLLEGLQGMGASARAAMQGGQNPLAAGLGGFIGGGVSGAARPSLDEERENARESDRLRGRIGFELERRGAEADVNYKAAKPALEMKKITEDSRIEGERQKIQRDLEAGRITRSEADLKQKELDRQSREREGKLNRESRQQVAGMNAANKDVKVPDSLYRGKNKEALKDAALARVLSSGQYDKSQIRPEVLEAFEGDLDKLQRAIKAGTLQPGEAFTDPHKGATFQRELANAHLQLSREAEEFDRAVDMTSKASSATKITYADFETTFNKYVEDMRAATDEKQRQQIKRQFQQALASVRLAGND